MFSGVAFWQLAETPVIPPGLTALNYGRWVSTRVASAGGSLNRIGWSNDGITWNGGYGFYSATVSVNGICYGVAWGKDKFVAVGTNGNSTTPTIVYYSYDGINWTAGSGITGAAGGTGRAVAYNGTRWVMVGAIGATTPTATAWYSADGINWTATTTNVFTATTNAIGYGIAWNGLLWVAVGTNGSATNSANTTNSANSASSFESNSVEDEKIKIRERKKRKCSKRKKDSRK